MFVTDADSLTWMIIMYTVVLECVCLTTHWSEDFDNFVKGFITFMSWFNLSWVLYRSPVFNTQQTHILCTHTTVYTICTVYTITVAFTNYDVLFCVLVSDIIYLNIQIQIQNCRIDLSLFFLKQQKILREI